MPNWRTDDAQGLTDEDTPIDPLTCPARTKLTNNIRKRTKRVVVNQNKRTSNAQELLRGKTVSFFKFVIWYTHLRWIIIQLFHIFA